MTALALAEPASKVVVLKPPVSLFDCDAGVYLFCADTFTILAAVGAGGRAAWA